MFRLAGLLLLPLFLAACAAPRAPLPQAPAPEAPAGRALSEFAAVVRRVGPVAEQECNRAAPGRDCRFMIFVDDRPGEESNAFQTVDSAGRPVLVFSLPLIEETRNRDEMAFVIGHEAGHHIAGHLALTQANAEFGAMVLGSLAQAYGYRGADLENAARFGAEVGSRRFSKEFELEADAIGTIIARRAGYDPVAGVAFFARSPDPGDEFLGTHPPNSARQAVVLRTAAAIP